MLWIGFIVLFNGAALGLELLEGNKITTTEYYGLRNLGMTFLFFGFILSLACSAAAMLLTIVLNKFVGYAWIRTLLYGGLGLFVGWRMFRLLYSEDFVESYELNTSTALLLFGLLGIMYGLLEIGVVKLDARLRRG